MCGRGRVLAEPRLSPDGEAVAFVATAPGRAAHRRRRRPRAARNGRHQRPRAAADRLLWWRHLRLDPVVGRAGLRRRRPPALSPTGDRGPPRLVVADGPVAGARRVARRHPGGLRPRRPPRGGGVARGRRPGPSGCPGDTDFAFDPAWSPDGRFVAWHEWDVPAMPWDDSRIVVAPGDGTGARRAIAVGRHGEAAAVSQPRFSPDGALSLSSAMPAAG